MVALRVLLLLGAALVVVATTRNDSSFVAWKCCPPEEELNWNLTACQPVATNATWEPVEVSTAANATSAPVEVSTAANATTGPVEVSTATNATSAPVEVSAPPGAAWDAAANESAWGEAEVRVWGRGLDCGDGRAVRLDAARDRDRFAWRADGSLALRSRTARGAARELVFRPEDGAFCADGVRGARGERGRGLVVCACARVRCVAKCCPPGEALVCDRADCSCRAHAAAADWNPLHPDLPPPAPADDVPFEVVVYSNVTCAHGFEALTDAFAGYPFYMVQKFWRKLFTDEDVCGDVVHVWYATPRHGLTRCMRPFPFPTFAGLAHWLHVPEAVLLAVTLATIVVVPRRRVSAYSYVHDMAMVGHAASLLGRSLLWPAFIKKFLIKCAHIPIAIYFFSVAASFWLNVICINMVCGFWKPLGPQRGGYGAARRMLLWYSLYAWGASVAMTTFTAVMWYARDVPAGLIRPTLHETRTCFRENEAEGKVATFAYFYGPMAGLLAANAALFSTTALRVRQLSRHAAVLGRKFSTSTEKAFRNERSLMIYVKLLWLMGVVETALEIATWASHLNEFYNAIAVSCLDVARAAAIFVMCCCKQRTLRALRERAGAWRALCRRRAGGHTQRPAGPGRPGKEAAADASCDTELTACPASH